jgi:hypothetical protein
MRVRTKFSSAVDSLTGSEGVVRLGNNDVRVIKFELDSGETETLLTNLSENFDFKGLYFKRWGVEKEYNVLKNTLEIENFSGRTETAIKQDFYIHVIASNMLAAAFWEAQEIVEVERNNGNNKYEYKVNVSQAAGHLRDYIIPAIITESTGKRERLMGKMVRDIADSVVPVRPNRKTARKSTARKAKFHHNSKSNL